MSIRDRFTSKTGKLRLAGFARRTVLRLLPLDPAPFPRLCLLMPHRNGDAGTFCLQILNDNSKKKRCCIFRGHASALRVKLLCDDRVWTGHLQPAPWITFSGVETSNDDPLPLHRDPLLNPTAWVAPGFAASPQPCSLRDRVKKAVCLEWRSVHAQPPPPLYPLCVLILASGASQEVNCSSPLRRTSGRGGTFDGSEHAVSVLAHHHSDVEFGFLTASYLRVVAHETFSFTVVTSMEPERDPLPSDFPPQFSRSCNNAAHA